MSSIGRKIGLCCLEACDSRGVGGGGGRGEGEGGEDLFFTVTLNGFQQDSKKVPTTRKYFFGMFLRRQD